LSALALVIVPDVSASESTVALTPTNTKIQFVGIHTGDKPDPRTGKFSKLTGSAKLADDQLEAIVVEIDTTSLTTEIDKLTTHLKSSDFFDVREHPKAVFKSTSIESGDDGQVLVKGNLTLMGETKPVSFPAKVSMADGLKLEAKFELDRTQFGMNYGVDRVDKMVTMTIAVGK
jgi:polyisoprenoid-binding protein YceI